MRHDHPLMSPGLEQTAMAWSQCNTRYRAPGLELSITQKTQQHLMDLATFIVVLIFIWAPVAEWYRYWTVACLVTNSSPVPLKTRRAGQRCTLNLSRAETSYRWCGVVVRRGSASSGAVHVT
ncbi:uncharacterized protein TNCV_2837581 [Trichonephila clavipes]|nr:uncharacterized protein TNCV_2837581 [Trichonephila clavipes]